MPLKRIHPTRELRRLHDMALLVEEYEGSIVSGHDRMDTNGHENSPQSDS
jgi:hypothetical protein